jgi:hypothetical protein
VRVRNTAPILLVFCGAAFGASFGAPAAEPDLYTTLPPGWKVTQNVVLPPDQAAAISRRLGGEITRVSNTVLDVQGVRLQVNVITCPTAAAATKVQASIMAAHGGAADCALLSGSRVIEFVGDDLRLIRRAPYVLGLRPKVVTYRIAFDAAPLEGGDWMSWNTLFNHFVALEKDPQDAQALAGIETLSKDFRFSDTLLLRTRGQGDRKSVYVLKPAPAASKTLCEGDLVRYALGPLPRRAGVPCLALTATVTSEAFALVPTQRKAGKELLGPTAAWPASDAEVMALAARITAGAKTDEDKVAALLDWLMPGKNLRFAGAVTGSRYGVKKVLDQGFGHCWDFSDCFVTLCRAAGVPSRQVAGWLYGQSGHIWAEVLLAGKGWREVDPTAGMACGSDYIAFLTSETGDMPLVYLSMPKIEIVKSE